MVREQLVKVVAEAADKESAILRNHLTTLPLLHVGVEALSTLHMKVDPLVEDIRQGFRDPRLDNGPSTSLCRYPDLQSGMHLSLIHI
mgnify:CR=1 FL=1